MRRGVGNLRSKHFFALQSCPACSESRHHVGKVVDYLHPSALQWASGSNKGAWHREGQPPLATSGTRLKANSVPLEEAEWRHQVGCWSPKQVKWKISRHRGGSGGKDQNQRWPASGALQRTIMQSTTVPPSGGEAAGLHRVAVF